MDSETHFGSYSPDRDHLCLDFVNTLSWRASDHPHDWLDSYDNLVNWGRVMGLVSENEAVRLQQTAAGVTQPALAVLQRAIALREAIYRLLSVNARGFPLKEVDLDTFNHELRIASPHRFLAWTPEGYAWRWDQGLPALDCMLWPVAQSATDLLTSEMLDRVGECQGEGCGWLFLDASKNKSRRWCSMNDCGNREKARQFYRRKKGKLEPPLLNSADESPGE